MGQELSVLVVDDRPLVIDGLRLFLNSVGIGLTAHARMRDEALALLRDAQPDVVVTESRIGDRDHLPFIADVHQLVPQLPIVIYTSNHNPTHVARAIAYGASDYVLKQQPLGDLVNSINSAKNGTPPRQESLFARMKVKMSVRSNADDPGYGLTNREMQVLRHIALGLSNRELALALHVTRETAKEHVQNVLRKTNAVDRTQAAVLAIKLKLI